MAGFADLIQNLVRGAADSLTKTLQTTITHEAWIGQDGSGKDQFASGVVRHAIVERRNKPYRTIGGQVFMQLADVTLLEKVTDTTPNAGQTRLQPFDPRDRITLSDGQVAPIIEIKDLENPVTQRGYLNQIVLGTG